MTGEEAQVVLRQIGTLYSEGAIGGCTDAELLERFSSGAREAAEAAFAVLVERHAPMVIQVCRRMLDNVHDAQDASQATFLVLARKVHSIKRREALGSWLHGVALKVAAKARVAATRRRLYERRGGQMIARNSERARGPEPWPEL